MKTASFATAAVLLSTSYAASVLLETTQCLDPNIPLQQVNIELNTSGPITADLQQVCGLRIVSSDTDVNTVSCQAFKDAAGTQPGSTLFTYAQPALIATNPVQEKAIQCTYPTTSNHVRRQNNDTASVAPISTLSSIVTLPVSSVPAEQSTITSTMVVTASTGMPSLSGNSTTPSMSLRPSASQTGEAPRESKGAASEASVGMGMGVVAAAAVLAMLL